jgi:DNA-binding XRE family transcriptional regulator
VPKIDGFDVAAYKNRLRLLREIISGENQVEFAERLGVPFKRWSNYERGYPVPRETAFTICKKFPGMSVEWIWWGWMGNLSEYYLKRIAAAEALDKERLAAERTLLKAQAKYKDVAAKRRKAIHPAPSPSRGR